MAALQLEVHQPAVRQLVVRVAEEARVVQVVTVANRIVD
jgi:hypothetical protein